MKFFTTGAEAPSSRNVKRKLDDPSSDPHPQATTQQPQADTTSKHASFKNIAAMEAWKVSSTGLLEWARGLEPYKAINVYGEPFSGKSTLVLTSIMGGLPDADSGVFLYGTGSLIEAHLIAEMAGHAKRGMSLSLRVAVLKDPKEVASHTGNPGKVLLVMTHQTMRAVLSVYEPSTNTTIFLDQDPDASVEYVMSLTSALSHTENQSRIAFRFVILSEEPLNDWQQGLINKFTGTRVLHATMLEKVQAPTVMKFGFWENPAYASRDGRIEFVHKALLSGGRANLLWVGHIPTAARVLKDIEALKYAVTSTTDPDDFERTYQGRDTTQNVVVMVDYNLRLSPKWLQSLGITHIVCTGNDGRSNIVTDTFLLSLVQDQTNDGAFPDWQVKRMQRLSVLAGILAWNTHIEQPTGHDPQGNGGLLFCGRDMSAFLFRMVEHSQTSALRWIQRFRNGVPGSDLMSEMLTRLRWAGIVKEKDGQRRHELFGTDRANAFGELLAEVDNNAGATRILAGIKSKHAGAGDNLKTVLVSLAVILAFQLEKPVELSSDALMMDMDAISSAFDSMGPIDPNLAVGQPLAGLLWTTLVVWQCYEIGKGLSPNSIVSGDVYVFEQMTLMREHITKKLGLSSKPLGPTTSQDLAVIYQELYLSNMDRIFWVDVGEGSHWPGTPSRGMGHGIRVYHLACWMEVSPGPYCQLLDVRSRIISHSHKRGLWAVSSQPLIETSDDYLVADLNYIPIDTIRQWTTHKVDRDQDDVERPTELTNVWDATMQV